MFSRTVFPFATPRSTFNASKPLAIRPDEVRRENIQTHNRGVFFPLRVHCSRWPSPAIGYEPDRESGLR